MPDADRIAIPEVQLKENAIRDGTTHLSTGIAVVREGKVLVVRRAASDFLGGNYELPGGGVDDGEPLRQAVQRELLEETGLRLEFVVGMFPSFEYTTPVKPRVRQLNFLVTASGEVQLSDEHDALIWVDANSIRSLSTTPLMLHCIQDALTAATKL